MRNYQQQGVEGIILKRFFLTVVFALFLFAQVSFAQSVKVETVQFQGKGCFKITTPWSTMYFEKDNGVSGFKGVFDRQGKDWLQSYYGWGTNPEYRGFPNATQSDFGHAGRASGSTNTIVGPSSGEHVIIESYTTKMKFRYHFFATHGAIEVLQASETYCFLWEGMVGPTVDPADFFIMSDGIKRYAKAEVNTFSDIPDEWVYFGDPNLNDVFLMGKRPDDNIKDENWRRLTNFELYSFGRGDLTDQCTRRLTGTQNYFVWTMIPRATTHAQVQQMITGLFANPYVPYSTQPLQPALGLSPASLSFSAFQGMIPAAQTVTATNTGSGTLANVTTAITYPSGSGWLTVTRSGAGNSQTLSNAVNVTGLAAGSYSATVRVDCAGATGSPKNYTVNLTVKNASTIHMKINAGANTVTGWEADDPYVSGGADYALYDSYVLSGVTNPAPNEVYQTVRHLSPTFTISIPNGTYGVRLHFADPGYAASATSSSRKINVTIEGQSVLTNYDVCASAGGGHKADIKSFNASVSDGNGMTIVFANGTGDDAFVNGIEVISGGVGIGHGAVLPQQVKPAIFWSMGEKLFINAPDADYEVRIYDMKGCLLDQVKGSGGVGVFSYRAGKSGGIRMIELRSKSERISGKAVLVK